MASYSYLVKSGTLDYYVERGGSEIPIKVEWKFWPGMRGKRDKYGLQLEPDDDAEFEILKVTDRFGAEIDLTDSEEVAIVNELVGLELMDYNES